MVVGLSPDDLGQRVVLVLSFEKLELLTFCATLVCNLQFFILSGLTLLRVFNRPSHKICKAVLMLEAFLLRCRIVIKLVVLRPPEDARWLHSSSPLRAKNTLDLYAPVHLEQLAIVADPVLIWHLIDPIALLMNRNVAYLAENDLVLILVVSVVADGTQLILDDKPPLSSGE